MRRRLRGEPGDALTARQRDVTALVCEGLRNKEIADRLGIAEHTVDNTLTDTYVRLGVTNRVELAVLAVLHPEALDGERSET